MPASTFKNFAQDKLAALLAEPGCVLYSAAATLQRGDLYILGLNPRGSKSDKTIAKDLDDLPTRTRNGYIDGQWKNHQRGKAPIQRRIAWLVKQLGHELRAVCASNLIFTSSRDAVTCGYPERADLCWPVHELILDIVRPRCILAYGNSGKSPYRYLRDRWLTDGQQEDRFPAGHGSWECRAFRATVSGRDTLIVGLPHLARYSPIGKDAVVNKIRKLASL
jgi:hypothetical protein